MPEKPHYSMKKILTMYQTVKSKYIAMPKQVKASLWFLVCSVLQKGITTLTTPIFTRLLSTVEYGQFSVFNSWLGIVSVFVCLDLYAGVYTRGLVKFSEDRNAFSSSLQGLSLTLVTFWTIVYTFTQNFWNNLFSLTTVQMYAMLLMIWASSAFRFWATEQRVKLTYKSLVLVTLAVSLFKPIVGIIVVINSTDKVTARILGLAIVELVCYTYFFVIQMKRGKVFFSKKYWKHALSFNIPLVPHYLSQTILNHSDRIMISEMVGNSEAGLYSLAYSIAMIMILVNTALTQTINPWIYQKIKENKVKEITRVGYASLIIVIVMNLLLIIFAPEILKIFAPSSYYDAVWVIPPVALSVVFIFSYSLFAGIEFYYKKTKLIMLASLLAALLNIGLNYVFINIFGYIAAAYTTLICYIVYSIGHFVFMNRVCDKYLDGVRIYSVKIIFGLFVSFLVLGLSLQFTYYSTVIRYAVFAVFIVSIIVFRNKIKTFITQLIEIRKKKG